MEMIKGTRLINQQNLCHGTNHKLCTFNMVWEGIDTDHVKKRERENLLGYPNF